MREEKKLDVYNEKVEELYKRLETNINGLSEIEAKKRLERDGENKLEVKVTAENGNTRTYTISVKRNLI